MKLKHITFTGIDGRTDLDVLKEIQEKYPIVEWGVLISNKWKGNGNRYFNPSYLNALASHSLNLSCHLCGSVARAAVNGNWDPFVKVTRGNFGFFNRCQLNITRSDSNPEKFILTDDVKMCLHEIILQQRGADDCQMFMDTFRNGPDEPVTTLLDASGGDGIDTDIVPLNLNHKIGYAGGINENNVADKLRFLMESDSVHDFWIDMESGVRTKDWFDTNKVLRILENCDDVLKTFGETIKK